MIAIQSIVVQILLLLGITGYQPTVALDPAYTGAFEHHDGVVRVNAEIDCEKQYSYCFMALSHEIGGHWRDWMLCRINKVTVCYLTEQSAYLAALNLTVGDKLANDFAYEYWYVYQ